MLHRSVGFGYLGNVPGPVVASLPPPPWSAVALWLSVPTGSFASSMKVLLVNPFVERMHLELSYAENFRPPLGLAYCAARITTSSV
jgi:hypothetical protein